MFIELNYRAHLLRNIEHLCTKNYICHWDTSHKNVKIIALGDF